MSMVEWVGLMSLAYILVSVYSMTMLPSVVRFCVRAYYEVHTEQMSVMQARLQNEWRAGQKYDPAKDEFRRQVESVAKWQSEETERSEKHGEQA